MSRTTITRSQEGVDDGGADARRVAERLARRRGGHAAHIDVVLHAEGHAMQRAAERRRHRVQQPITAEFHCQTT